MILTRQYLIIIIVVHLNYGAGHSHSYSLKVLNPTHWKTVESLAEEYPYVVGLLNRSKEYMCTGIIVNKRTVLTSGSCIDPALYYIAVASAVISNSMNCKNLFTIAATKVHSDYVFELRPADPNITRMHSNVGLIYSEHPNLLDYIPAAEIGNYFASELHDKNVKVVGFGKITATDLVVLQHQSYHQTPCTNPKWYYCICGSEYSAYTKTYNEEFGKGAPVFYGYKLIGIAATPCGTLASSKSVNYNIFTIIGPYLPWVEKKPIARSQPITMIETNKGYSYRDTDIDYVYILFVIGIVFY